MKRTSTDAGLDTPGSMKERRRYHHHHELSWRQKIDDARSPAFQDNDSYDKQLLRAISLVLSAVGFEHADPTAMESFRMITQEYMSHFLAAARQSMLSARRVQPLPHDFLSALNAHNLTLSSLLPHLNPPVSGAKSQPPLLVEPPPQHDKSLELELIGNMLQEPSSNKTYIPAGLPALPSRHTYKAEPVYSRRDIAPKEVRERATEEGRLGEEALRRLVGSQFRAQNHLEATKKDRTTTVRQRGRELWKQTMAASLRGDVPKGADAVDIEAPTSEFDDYSIRVNADSIYWRKPVANRDGSMKASET